MSPAKTHDKGCLTRMAMNGSMILFFFTSLLFGPLQAVVYAGLLSSAYSWDKVLNRVIALLTPRVHFISVTPFFQRELARDHRLYRVERWLST